MRDGEIILKENKEELLKNYGIVEQPVESFNICNEYLVASRERNHNRISLVNNYQEVPELNKSTILMMLLKLLCEVTNNERFSIKYSL